MRVRITNIGGGNDPQQSATIAFQEVRDPDVVPVLGVSTVNLVVPIADAQDYAYGVEYDLVLTKATQ